MRKPSRFLDDSLMLAPMETCTLRCCGTGSETELGPDAATDVATAFKALGDTHRVRVVDLLVRAGEPVCVVDIERHLPLAQSTVSYHLKALVDAGLLDRERRGRWMYYSVRPERLRELRDALGSLVR